jgi:hypothetical protein
VFWRDWGGSCIAGKSLDFIVRDTSGASSAHMNIVKVSEWSVAVVQPAVWLYSGEPTYVDISLTRDVPML